MEVGAVLVEKTIVQKRFSKALFSYNENAVVQQQIHHRLMDLLQQTGRASFHRILEIGCGTGGFTSRLTSSCCAGEWMVNDLFDVCVEKVANCFINKSWQYVPGDAEQLTFPGNFDMVASASVIQWFESPERFIQKIASQLNSDGILLFNTFGKNNLQEIKAITGKGLSYPSLTDVESWVGPDFDILHLQDEEIQLEFSKPLQVLHHLKSTGVTGTNKTIWTRTMLQQFCDEYLNRYSVNRNVTLTYHPIYVLAVKR